MTTVPTVEAMPRTGRGVGAEDDPGHPLTWDEAQRRLEAGGWFWLATTRPDGAPHLVPVLAAWGGQQLYIASKDTARKARNLTANERCSVSTDAGDVHLVIEGDARRLDDPEDLHRASEAFAAVQGWPTVVAGDQLDAEGGAPTSGGPPYGVWALTPRQGFAFPSGEVPRTPTRWRFPH